MAANNFSYSVSLSCIFGGITKTSNRHMTTTYKNSFDSYVLTFFNRKYIHSLKLVDYTENNTKIPIDLVIIGTGIFYFF
ncbi:hypothetical protein MtrunA17_Chr7g0227521 [Medicago truncatula]|uniref:Uncharacterized protein n=1 Tax=Medicago truncatula TaxID=3880 RepID=A0A396H2Q3_MEDTR|nr:hypothetical protein MtrunA17_Chr7g0227521 [Medicago truncatula]